jgi:DNA-binding LytR/AlgR family response regulator
MNYKIAICDDAAPDRAYLMELAKTWAEKNGHTLQLSLFSSAEEFLFHYEDPGNYDILLLDIEMGAMDGVTLAKKIRKENETVQIVFITGYSDYISEGYEVAALHYLMKPVGAEKLWQVFNRAAEKLRKDEQVLTLEIGGEMVRIPIYQIRYIDVYGNYATIHGRENYKVRKTLGELASLLDERFYRAGRSVIVNLTCIRRVTKTDIYLNDGSSLPLPRGAYEGVNQAIIHL